MNAFEYIVHSSLTGVWSGFQEFAPAFKEFRARAKKAQCVALWHRVGKTWTQVYSEDLYPRTSRPV